MSQNRREFLKKAGLGALAGLGAAAGLFPAFALEQTDMSNFTDKPVPGKVRWGKQNDTRKFLGNCTE